MDGDKSLIYPTEQDQKNKTQSAFFKSTTDRFSKIDAMQPNIRILDSSTASNKLRKGSTTVTHHSKNSLTMTNFNHSGGSNGLKMGSGGVVSYLHSGPQWTHKMRSTDYEMFAGKKVGFDATSPRFNYN
jgi:hypothetical protein